MIPIVIIANVYSNVQNASVSETQDLSHQVARVSSFKYTAKSSKINYDAGGVNIASITVANNTIDGFTLTVASQEGGVLAPASTLDGEQDIQFGIALEVSGTEGTGVNVTETLASNALSDPNTPADIISMAGSQSSPTSLEISVDISLSADVENAMSMAGSYSDTLTFTYTDL